MVDTISWRVGRSQRGIRFTVSGIKSVLVKNLVRFSLPFNSSLPCTLADVPPSLPLSLYKDIYVVADNDEAQMVMKIHRLGRMSFRAIKTKRDYLKKGQSASWMYMSRLAAIKEYAFMKVLYEHDFPVPKPIDQSRHCLIMELIDAFPLYVLLSTLLDSLLRDCMS